MKDSRSAAVQHSHALSTLVWSRVCHPEPSRGRSRARGW